MRYLNKIVFINSAHINYSEINLEGNVHFTGTQGTGKSTLLRAILFFYNADTSGLGIPVQKQSYTDYYFQKLNSYIIYEVVRDENKYCVVTYKSQHRVCFRFFDGGYRREFFVSATGQVPDSWEGIAQQLDANKVFYTKRKIDEYKEYRDILYGNHVGKKTELKKYSILESKDFQHIPKTIQNVFLNSKMEAEFIKRTIIMSLDNDVQIDLRQYSHHLKDFETQLNDIRKFKTPSATSQAESISKLYSAIKYLEKEKIRLARELAWAMKRIEHEEPELTGKLQLQHDTASVISGKLAKLDDSFHSKENKIRGEVSILDENLKKARKLTDEYEKKNIRQIIERVEKKNIWESERQKLLDEKELLSTQFKEIAQKYQALLNNLDNNLNEFCNTKNAEKNNFNAGFLAFKEEIRKKTEGMIATIREEHQKGMDEARTNLEYKRTETHELKIKRESIKHRRFFEDEIKGLDAEINTLNNSIHQLDLENDNAQQQIEMLQKRWEIEHNDLDKNLEREKEKINGQISQIKVEIAEIEQYIENSRNSLYGWLNEHYPDWENTIGKVIDEKNVLFNTELAPKFSGNSGTFYGIEINLDEINKNVKTIDDYEEEKSNRKEKSEQLQHSLDLLMEQIEKDKENLKRRFQPKIREKKEAVKENEYASAQNCKRLSEATVARNSFTDKATTEKKKYLDEINADIEKAAEAELAAKKAIENLEDTIGKQIKAKERERDKKIDAEAEQVKQALAKIDTEIETVQETNRIRKSEINTQKDKELLQKGADTQRLNAIDAQLTRIGDELDFIDHNRDTVADYRKDKRECLDRVDEFKAQKGIAENQLAQEEQKYEREKAKIGKELGIVRETIESFNKTLRNMEEDKEEFDNFRKLDLFNAINEHFANPTNGDKNGKRAKTIIDEIKDTEYGKLAARMGDLRTVTIEFVSKFSDDNIFKFKKQHLDDTSILDFALMLTDFIEEHKLERIEKEVNERFSLIITTIGTETGSLLSASGRIQDTVNKINNDFVERMFSGVIKKIELRVDESKNEVVQLLKKIKEFNDKNSHDLGERNLFSSNEQDKKNKEAVDLLKQFVKKIGELKKDCISLSDSFELKFRIEENQNSTGWVEKLANVGSDGTDVLVKAMVNIMLLNVFKESASKKFKDFKLHCMMDEIGKLHPNNVRGILKFANDRNIMLINGSPIENDALAYQHIYQLRKDENSITRINRVLTQYS